MIEKAFLASSWRRLLAEPRSGSPRASPRSRSFNSGSGLRRSAGGRTAGYPLEYH